MTYRLTYWPKRGRAEQVRLLLNDLGLEYEDAHISREDLVRIRTERPGWSYFGSVPVLEDGDFRLCQGPVVLSYLARRHGVAPTNLELAAKADAIALGAEDLRIAYFTLFGPGAPEKQAAFVAGAWSTRWLPNLSTLLVQNGGEVFVGKAVTHADIAVWDAIDATVTWVEGARARLGDFATLAAFYDRIATRPRIAAYLGSGRRVKG